MLNSLPQNNLSQQGRKVAAKSPQGRSKPLPGRRRVAAESRQGRNEIPRVAASRSKAATRPQRGRNKIPLRTTWLDLSQH